MSMREGSLPRFSAHRIDLQLQERELVVCGLVLYEARLESLRIFFEVPEKNVQRVFLVFERCYGGHRSKHHDRGVAVLAVVLDVAAVLDDGRADLRVGRYDVGLEAFQCRVEVERVRLFVVSAAERHHVRLIIAAHGDDSVFASFEYPPELVLVPDLLFRIIHVIFSHNYLFRL